MGGGWNPPPPCTYLYIASEPLGGVSSYLVTFIYMFLQSNVQSFGSLDPFHEKIIAFSKKLVYLFTKQQSSSSANVGIHRFFQNAPVDSIFYLCVRYLVYALVIPPNLTW